MNFSITITDRSQELELANGQLDRQYTTNPDRDSKKDILNIYKSYRKTIKSLETD